MATISEDKFLYPKLRGRIIEKYRNYKEFADAIGEYDTVVSRKLSGNLGLTKKDISIWANALDLELKDYGEYFFAD